MKNDIIIGGKSFKYKKDAEAEYHRIKYQYHDGAVLEDGDEDFPFMRDVFINHPKILNHNSTIKCIAFVLNNQNGATFTNNGDPVLHHHVILENDEIEYFISKKHMFSKSITPEQLADIQENKLKEHIRNAVRYQIHNHRNSVVEDNGYLKCEHCGDRDSSLDVHHTRPIIEMFLDCAIWHNFEIEDVIGTDVRDGSKYSTLNDPYDNLWVCWHLDHAELEVLCKPCHTQADKIALEKIQQELDSTASS